MMTTIMKYNQAFHTLLLLGVALATALTFLISATTFHIPGFALISFAHATDVRNTAIQEQTQLLCASKPSTQNCTNKDPIAQGCDTDAQTLAFKDILDAQGNLLATIQRRYSPICHSEWGRITDDGKEPLQIIVNKNARSTQGTVVYSVMVFVPNLSVAPEIMGTVSMNGINPAQAGSQGQETAIPALPSVQSQ